MTHRLTIFWMYAIGCLRMMYLFLPIYTLFLVDHGIAMNMIVFAPMFYSVGQFIFEVPTGVFADLFGQRISLFIGFFLEALGLVAVLIWPNAIGLCVSYAFGGIAAAFLSGSEEALIFENAAQANMNHAKVYGAYLNSQTIGMIAANIIGGAVFALFGHAVSVPLIAITAALLGLCAVMTLGLREPARPTPEAKSQGSRYFSVLQEGLSIIKQDKLLKTVTIVSTLIIPGEFFLYNIYQPLFQEAHVGAVWFGWSISIGLLLNATFTALLGRVEKRFTLEKILSVVTVICGASFLLLSSARSAIPAVLGVIGVLSMVEIYRPVVSDYVNERIPSARRVTVLSSISFAQRVASAFLRVCLTGAIVLWGVRGAAAFNGVYLVIGAGLALWLLVRCGCTHRLKHQPVPLLPDVHA